jgi:hypothetical protein
VLVAGRKPAIGCRLLPLLQTLREQGWATARTSHAAIYSLLADALERCAPTDPAQDDQQHLAGHRRSRDGNEDDL